MDFFNTFVTLVTIVPASFVTFVAFVIFVTLVTFRGRLTLKYCKIIILPGKGTSGLCLLRGLDWVQVVAA